LGKKAAHQYSLKVRVEQLYFRTVNKNFF